MFIRFVIRIAVALLVSSSVAGNELRLDKIEPPNWWANMHFRKVQLMLYGEGLTDFKASFNDARIRVTSIDHAQNANYAFINVELAEDLPPGEYVLRLSKLDPAEVSIETKYSILARERTANRHQGFGPDDTVYLITPDRFANGDRSNDRAEGVLDEYDPTNDRMRHGGDLQGVIDHLDYLQDLGITAIWLNPVLENRGINSYHGYKATDLYKIDPRFGSNDLYRQFVRAAHDRGIKVIFDHVANHVGLLHPWIKNLPTKTWLNGSVEQHLSNKHYLLSLTDPHSDPQSQKELKTFWFVDKMPDLNQRDPHLAKYLIQNSIWWIEFSGLDGIREDTYPYADQAFLADWAQAIRTEYPRFNIVGEIWATKSAYIAHFQDKTILPRNFETNLPAVMDFPLMQSFRGFLKGTGKLRDIYDTYAQDFLFTDVDNLLVFADNHDTARMMFEADGDKDKVKLILTLLLTSRGIPQILYGTEIGMLGGQSHVELRADFPGGFPSHDRSAFTATGRTPFENEMHTHVKKLLHLRKNHRAISRGKMIHYAPTWSNDVYRVLHTHDDERILVLANGHDQQRKVELTDLSHHWKNKSGKRQLRDLLTGEIVELNSGVTLSPFASRVFEATP